MHSALIGWTGFVGSNIDAAHEFTDRYNTSNIDDIRGGSYDLVVSAAARADSHRINNAGEQDRAEIDAYVELLSTVEIGKLVLVSTVCIYPGDTSPDETTPLSPEGLTPYGANRLHMEQSLAARFDTLALRLPQLYGIGLKKGVVYDLLNDYRVMYTRDMRTVHAALYGGPDGYLLDEAGELAALTEFVREARAARSAAT